MTAATQVKPARSLAMLVLGSALMQAAVVLSSTASTLLFAADFGDRWGGLPSTAAVSGVVVGSVGLTRLMGRAGRRPGLVAAYAVAAAGAGCALAGVLVQPLLVVAGLFLLGFGNAGSQLARYAGAELYPASRQGFALGAVVWAGTIGAVGGSALLAPAGGAAGRVGLPALAGAFLLAIAATGMASLVTTGVHRAALPHRRQPLPPSTPTTRVALVAMVVSQVVMVAIMIAAPLHMHHHGYGLGAVGLAISVHTLGMYALAPLSGYLCDRFGSDRLLVAGLALLGATALAIVMAAQLTGPALLVVLFTLGYGWNLSIVGGSALLVRDVRTQGTVEAWVWGGSAVGAFSSTQLFAVGGYRFLAAASVAVAVVALAYVVRARG